VLTLLDQDVARGACATAATGMFQMDAEVHGDVEERLGFAVIVIRQFAQFELYCFVLGQECHFRHTSF
jgi:hypothetical protein